MNERRSYSTVENNLGSPGTKTGGDRSDSMSGTSPLSYIVNNDNQYRPSIGVGVGIDSIANLAASNGIILNIQNRVDS